MPTDPLVHQPGRRFHFISGLPRSGSTLLAAILNQNPRFHAGMTSPLADIMGAVMAEASSKNDFSYDVSDEQRVAMLGAIKKNDRVVTAGGIYGIVASVNREADEVVVKVDETTNTKLRMTLSSVTRVLGDAPSDEKSN